MTRLGEYELVELLGRGGTAEVYLARDTRGRRVALKKLDMRLSDEPENFLERFRREGELLRSIHHRTLPAIYDVGVSADGEPYLTMEYLHGDPLSRWVGASPLETIPLLIQLAEGLREIALRGVVHRDLSPDNVLVVREGHGWRVKIIDFGIAKEVGRKTELTSSGYFFGKLQYCSPEHVGLLEEGESIDWRSDLYSFGLVAYHVLAGRLPFRATEPLGLVGAHLYEKPLPLESPAPPKFPRRLVHLIARTLEKDRARRPRSYDDVIRRLALAHAEILLASPETARLSSPPSTPPSVGASPLPGSSPER